MYMLPTRDSLKNKRQIDYIEETENLLHENKAELSLKHNFTDFKTKTVTRDIKRHCMCMLSLFSQVQLFTMLWTVCSLPGSSVHGILQARILEQVTMFSSRGYSQRNIPGIKPTSLMSPAQQMSLYHQHHHNDKGSNPMSRHNNCKLLF